MIVFRKLTLVLFLGLLLGCEKEEPIPEVDVFGNYVLFSVETENPYDFTNDGIASTNLKGQIEEAQSSLGTIELFITQRGTVDSEVDIMNIPLLVPNVLTTLPEGIPLVRYAANSYTIEVVFDQTLQQFLTFENATQSSTLKVDGATILTLNLLSEIQIEAKVLQEVYDFASQDWVEEPVTYRFNRTQ